MNSRNPEDIPPNATNPNCWPDDACGECWECDPSIPEPVGLNVKERNPHLVHRPYPEHLVRPYPERIVSCAHKFTDFLILVVPPPGRHHTLIGAFFDAFSKPLRGMDSQGFLTDRGRWVSREEGLVIAKAANQIYRRCSGDDEQLFSENLW